MEVYYKSKAGDRLEVRTVKPGMEDKAKELCETISRLRLQKARGAPKVIEEMAESLESDCLESLGSMLKPKINWNHC
ncbi:hypothetical protein VPH209E381_0007 [Vibrio phage 209E38-1]